jgi:hypothetical protein
VAIEYYFPNAVSHLRLVSGMIIPSYQYQPSIVGFGLAHPAHGWAGFRFSWSQAELSSAGAVICSAGRPSGDSPDSSAWFSHWFFPMILVSILETRISYRAREILLLY